MCDTHTRTHARTPINMHMHVHTCNQPYNMHQPTNLLTYLPTYVRHQALEVARGACDKLEADIKDAAEEAETAAEAVEQDRAALSSLSVAAEEDAAMLAECEARAEQARKEIEELGRAGAHMTNELTGAVYSYSTYLCLCTCISCKSTISTHLYTSIYTSVHIHIHIYTVSTQCCAPRSTSHVA